MTWTTSDIPDLAGTVAVVTGANGGLGLETADALAAAGAHVVMAARNQEKAALARLDIAGRHPTASLELVELDLGDLASVRDAAAGILGAHERIDLLVNNAGLMAMPESRTVDGFEMQFGVDHLGHFALTAHLLDALLRARAARVVTVTSTARHMGRAVDPTNPHLEGNYEAWRAYAQAKTANYHFALGLDRRLRAARASTRSLAAHPGLSNTELQARTVAEGGGGWAAGFFHTLSRTIGMTPATTARQLYGPMFGVRAAGRLPVAPVPKPDAPPLWEAGGDGRRRRMLAAGGSTDTDRCRRPAAGGARVRADVRRDRRRRRSGSAAGGPTRVPGLDATIVTLSGGLRSAARTGSQAVRARRGRRLTSSSQTVPLADERRAVEGRPSPLGVAMPECVDVRVPAAPGLPGAGSPLSVERRTLPARLVGSWGASGSTASPVVIQSMPSGPTPSRHPRWRLPAPDGMPDRIVVASVRPSSPSARRRPTSADDDPLPTRQAGVDLPVGREGGIHGQAHEPALAVRDDAGHRGDGLHAADHCAHRAAAFGHQWRAVREDGDLPRAGEHPDGRGHLEHGRPRSGGRRRGGGKRWVPRDTDATTTSARSRSS